MKRLFGRILNGPDNGGSEKGWEIKNVAGDDDMVDLLIYDVIGWPWIEASDVARALADVTASKIRVRINSPGGSVFDGYAIYNSLKNHPAKIEVVIDGLAASIASVIAMAGDKVVMEMGSFLMIHQPRVWEAGTAEDMEQAASILRKIEGELIATYQTKADLSAEELQVMLEAETWMTGAEAKKFGFADSVASDAVAHAQAAEKAFDLSEFVQERIPEKVVAHYGKILSLSKRDAEKALCEAGFSRSVAKMVASTGFGTVAVRDAQKQNDLPVADPEFVAVAKEAIASAKSLIEDIKND